MKVSTSKMIYSLTEHNLIQIRCLLYLFLNLSFDDALTFKQNPLWVHVRVHIFNRPISDESTKSLGIKSEYIFNCLANDKMVQEE